jgi:hypothetical protein
MISKKKFYDVVTRMDHRAVLELSTGRLEKDQTYFKGLFSLPISEHVIAKS